MERPDHPTAADILAEEETPEEAAAAVDLPPELKDGVPVVSEESDTVDIPISRHLAEHLDEMIKDHPHLSRDKVIEIQLARTFKHWCGYCLATAYGLHPDVKSDD